MDFEEFFKDKINWKDYNYILDRVTKMEDMGYDVSIYACVGPNTPYYMNVYTYQSKGSRNGFYSLEDFPKTSREDVWKNAVNGYKKYGLCFRMYALDTNSEIFQELPEKIYPQISDRLVRIEEFEGEEGELIVKSIS